jgi:cellulose 1,4-beta-cellobiosidase
MSLYSGNKAGAKYGTGYCDSQCPKDIKFINGEANLLNWNGTSANSGTGMYGTCCNEMDVWEANSIAAAYTPHPCTPPNQTRCSGTACTSTCDQAGCDFNSYRMGDLTFYGPGMTVDTTKKFTVVTQFITADNTATGALSEIRRFYVQNGVVIPNSMTNLPGLTTYNSVSDAFCAAQKTAVGDTNGFKTYGGMANMDTAFTNGVVLVLSIWDDYAVDMLWLDSYYPPTASQTAPGVKRGTCATTSGKPADVESASPNAQVIYSNIKLGSIGSTYAAGTTTTSAGTGGTTSHSSTPTTTASGATQTHYGQCGGTGFTGPTSCASPYTCTYSNAYYSQCL